ncbi:hypothetical protein B0I00_2430 [Novosphingobium kunmingense]|uniref:Lipoprotein n=1 Tax=Novosphingobium kunmingense TaxID=1211806 RepID=A0A2N0H7B9_9SPHN|nr:hypothetical protein [Novosphingobium kunmingense]PKB14828.1 hypothetical protein B0I00_2430 [Novosphingobium kunmingense]
MRFAKSLTLAAVAGLALSACTASRYQISDALMRYGMSENKASCAAEFLRGHLSTRQVDRLADAARYYNGNGALTFGDLVRVAASLRDTETAVQVGGAALACGLAADMVLPRF